MGGNDHYVGVEMNGTEIVELAKVVGTIIIAIFFIWVAFK